MQKIPRNKLHIIRSDSQIKNSDVGVYKINCVMHYLLENLSVGGTASARRGESRFDKLKITIIQTGIAASCSEIVARLANGTV